MCLLYRHEILSSGPQHPHKSEAQRTVPVDTARRRKKQGLPLKSNQQAQGRVRGRLENKGGKATDRDPMSTSGLHMHMFLHRCTHTHTQAHAHTHTFAHTHMQMHMYTHIHTLTHTYICSHTYIHTYIPHMTHTYRYSL